MNKELFFAKAASSNSFISESKILSQLADMKKAVIICMDDTQYFVEYFMNIKSAIEKLKMANFYKIEVQDSGELQIENLGIRKDREAEILNFVEERFKEYKGYCFVVDSGMQYLYSNGKIDEDIKSCLEKTKSMQKRLEVLKPVSSVREVFAHFIVECKYQKKYYEKCFNKEGMVKKEIKEQELRNILMQYLKKNMQGEVSVEFCTDYTNDEESVDIYLNDGDQRAIIEVKFSLSKKYYEGATNYNIAKRVGDGIKQLDKYAIHLSKDARLVDYGYVYMFYMNDMEEDTLRKNIDDKVKEVMDSASSDLHSIFAGVQTNDMMKWGKLASTY